MQRDLINPHNPRAIFFNDTTSVAWMAGGLIELMSYDQKEGIAFYTMRQEEVFKPRFTHEGSRCLICHRTSSKSLAPGFLSNSIPTDLNGETLPWLGNYITDQNSPLAERWGGWFVTGESEQKHLGNMLVTDSNIKSLPAQESVLSILNLNKEFDTKKYLSSYSDIVALMVFNHQITMMNLLIELSAQTKVLEHASQADFDLSLNKIIIDIVDYMLFVDEAPLSNIKGSSGFAEKFSTLEPIDNNGRSLRQLDLSDKLMKYSCSYMIYSDVFIKLPERARTAVYERLWEVLSGADKSEKYRGLSLVERIALIEILRGTKNDLPLEFENIVLN